MNHRGIGPTMLDVTPVLGSDPCVYTDPYPGARGEDLIKQVCGKCGGDGMYHAPSGYVIQNPYGPRGDAIRGCFDCMGVGHRIVKVSSVRARTRKHAKAAVQRKVDAEEYARRADERAAEEYSQAWDEAHAEQERRAALNNQPAGVTGDRIKNLTGVVEVALTREVPGFRYGTDIKRLVVVKLDTGQVVKTFGSGGSLFGVERGDRITIAAATVKDTDTYQGQLQTVLTRATLRVDVAVLRPADIAEGDEIESDGTWYRAVSVDERGVTVQAELGARRWLSVIRYRTITGHRQTPKPTDEGDAAQVKGTLNSD